MNTRQRISFTAALLFLLAGISLQAQDITSYTLRTEGEDIFQREVAAALATSPMAGSLPGLGCTVEYIRLLEGEDIVYRRGPIDMHLSRSADILESPVSRGKRPASEDDLRGSRFYGGLLVDLPRPGETTAELPLLPERYRYMLRVALIPLRYEDATLTATILLERAVVEEREDELLRFNSEIFSRTVELVGNLPLKFDLPEWDSRLPNGSSAVHATLREGVLVTLETPHAFNLPGSYPDPFRNSTLLTYTVPRRSTIRLNITVEGKERVLDEGVRQAGTYQVVWNAEDLPDDHYTAVFTAMDSDGTPLYRAERTLIKNRTAEPFTPEQFTMLRRDERDRIVLGLESGIGYQLPVDEAKSLRNLFTHLVLRIGYRLSSSWEIGVLAGQDAFHEKPGIDVDIDRITDYGGVIASTYGYFGPYLRWTTGHGILQPFFQVSAAWSDAAMLGETAFGLRTDIMRDVEIYLAPAAMFHLKSTPSTKLGIHYGTTVRF
ncbi:MAG: hypothetical protein JXA28_14025 [Bacteroidetes bacterium]|nr:hypothetical protein [Bacteroidota bacterium]